MTIYEELQQIMIGLRADIDEASTEAVKKERQAEECLSLARQNRATASALRDVLDRLGHIEFPQ